MVAVDVILGAQKGESRPDVVVCIVDASNIDRNLYLTTQEPASLAGVYLGAWRAGLKSTYYAFARPSMHAEATFAYDEARPRAHLETAADEVVCTTDACEVCQ